MKIKPLSPVFAAKITGKLRNKISKEFRNKIMVDTAKEDIDSIIVLGNGNVDDLVVPIVCHHLNGNRTVGIVKPDGKKRLNTLNEFYVYISGHKINKIAIVMDQEKDNLDGIFKQAEKILRSQNIRFETVINDNRFKQYKCKYGSRAFDLTIIISGLDDSPTKTHKIEDHLVKAALELSKITHSSLQDSKEIWKSVDDSTQSEILNKFIENNSISIKIFPQHFNGLLLLEG